jgi:hypothetical protein
MRDFRDDIRSRKTPMIEMTFDQVLKAALSLRPEQKAILVKTLQVAPEAPATPTRAQLIAELQALRAARAFEHVTSLRNQYPAPSLKHISDRQILAAIHETSSEWEADLEELVENGD